MKQMRQPCKLLSHTWNDSILWHCVRCGNRIQAISCHASSLCHQFEKSFKSINQWMIYSYEGINNKLVLPVEVCWKVESIHSFKKIHHRLWARIVLQQAAPSLSSSLHLFWLDILCVNSKTRVFDHYALHELPMSRTLTCKEWMNKLSTARNE